MKAKHYFLCTMIMLTALYGCRARDNGPSAEDSTTSGLGFFVSRSVAFNSSGSQGSFQGKLFIEETRDGSVRFEVKNMAGKFVAVHVYKIKDTNIVIEATTVKEQSDRRKGINERLVEVMLERHPKTTSIESYLTESNAEIYMDGIKQGLSPMESIRKTPAYLIRKKNFEVDESRSRLPSNPEDALIILTMKRRSL